VSAANKLSYEKFTKELRENYEKTYRSLLADIRKRYERLLRMFILRSFVN